MRLALGIDTGGTYTDAVLVDHDSGRVLLAAKALTTRYNLAEGIGVALNQVMEGAGVAGLSAQDIVLVGLSTTLATNALVERHRGAVTLLLLGYDRALMERYGFQRELATDDVVYVAGGHDESGVEQQPLDEATLRSEVLARRGRVEAFGVSGYFAVRNPTHELRAKALIETETGVPVTCGHELTGRLDAVRRATTVALNAHLILPLRELIAAVRRLLDQRQISAPLMVVKGDGSLVRDDWAMHRPVETILSGPAASAIGARHLANTQDAWLVDVGGTTTDIAVLRNGLPGIAAEGASVGGWRTMVEAIDARTAGLGGDSHVRLDGKGRMLIGPRRVVPLCLLATEFPRIVEELSVQRDLPPARRLFGAAEFVVRNRPPSGPLNEEERGLLEWLEAGPQSLARLSALVGSRPWLRRHIENLESRGLVRRAAFTPTDALHALGSLRTWEEAAARLAAGLLADRQGVNSTTFCEQVVQGVSQRIAAEIVSKALESDGHKPEWEREPTAQRLLLQALNDTGVELACSMTLRRPLVAVGAPVTAYLPDVAQRLHCELIIPSFAEVANAVGAVVGSVVQRRQVVIKPWPEAGDGWVRAHLPDGVRYFPGLEKAVAAVDLVGRVWVEELAQEAGAEQITVHALRQDLYAPVSGPLEGEVYLGTEMTFAATGRPSLTGRNPC